MSDSEYEDEERAVVMLDFQGVIDSDEFFKDQKSFKILGVDTEQPILQMGHHLFSGQYEDTMGTHVFFGKENLNSAENNNKEIASSDQYCCLYKTDKKLTMKRTFLEDKAKVSEPSASTSHAQSSNLTNVVGVPGTSRDVCNGNMSPSRRIQESLAGGSSFSEHNSQIRNVPEGSRLDNQPGGSRISEAGNSDILPNVLDDTNEVEDSVGSSDADCIILSDEMESCEVVRDSSEQTQSRDQRPSVLRRGHHIIPHNVPSYSSNEVSNSTPSTSRMPSNIFQDSVISVLHDIVTDVQEMHNQEMVELSHPEEEPMEIADSASCVIKGSQISESLLPLICDSASSEVRVVHSYDDDDLESGTSEAMDTTEGKDLDVGSFAAAVDADAFQISTSESAQYEVIEILDTSQSEVTGSSSNVGSTNGEPIDLTCTSGTSSQWVNEGIESSSTLVTASTSKNSSIIRHSNEFTANVNSTVAEGIDASAKTADSTDHEDTDDEDLVVVEEESFFSGNVSGSIDSTTNNVICSNIIQKDNSSKSSGIDSTTNESGSRRSYITFGSSSTALRPNESIDSTMNIFKNTAADEEMDFEMREAKNLSVAEDIVCVDVEEIEESEIVSTSGSIPQPGNLSVDPSTSRNIAGTSFSNSPTVSTMTCEVSESSSKCRQMYEEGSDSDSDSGQYDLVISYQEENDNSSLCKVTESSIDDNECTHSSDVKISSKSKEGCTDAADCQGEYLRSEVSGSSLAHLGEGSSAFQELEPNASPCEVSESCASSSKNYGPRELDLQGGEGSFNLVSESVQPCDDNSPLIIGTDSSPYAVSDSTNVSYSSFQREIPSSGDFARPNDDFAACEVTDSSYCRSSNPLNTDSELNLVSESASENPIHEVWVGFLEDDSAASEVTESSDHDRPLPSVVTGNTTSSSDGKEPTSSDVVVSSASDVSEFMSDSIVVSSANDPCYSFVTGHDMSINEVVQPDSDYDVPLSNSSHEDEVSDSSEILPNPADSTEGSDNASTSREERQRSSDAADSKLPSSTSN